MVGAAAALAAAGMTVTGATASLVAQPVATVTAMGLVEVLAVVQEEAMLAVVVLVEGLVVVPEEAVVVDFESSFLGLLTCVPRQKE